MPLFLSQNFMKIAITQRETLINDIAHDALDSRWYTLLKKHELIPIPNTGAMIPLDFDMLIISGGEITTQRTETELLYFKMALLKGIPILGVCHGAFFINEQFGGTNSTTDGHRNTEHWILLLGSCRAVEVNSFHNLVIDELSTDFLIDARTAASHLDKDASIEAFKHKKLPIWGVVWHPERMITPILPPELQKLLLC